eukprot:12146-Eustigmatos_ZCMA.PRE.1
MLTRRYAITHFDVDRYNSGGRATYIHLRPVYHTPQGPQYITPCDETQLMEALYYFGPISIYVNAYCSSFQ